MKLFRITCLAFLFGYMLSAPISSARAEDYIKPDLLQLVHTLVRFGAVSLDDMEVIDEYSRIAECALYNNFYQDDFKWHQIQQLLRKKLMDDAPTYPTAYYIDKEMQLDRYDFKSKLYRFTLESTPKNVNAFVVSDTGEGCGVQLVTIWPIVYRFVVDNHFTMMGLPLFEHDAETLLRRMDAAENKDHIVYARFKIKVLQISRYNRELDHGQVTGRLKQGEATEREQITSHLDAVEFYEDPERTKLIYVVRP